MPVSLESGKDPTVNFRINLRDSYWVRFEVDPNADNRAPEPCSSDSLNRARWKVYRLGALSQARELWADSAAYEYQGRSFEDIRGVPGRYQLEWTAPAESACLNSRHPLLIVSSDNYSHEQILDLIQGACLFPAGAGAMLILRGLCCLLLGFLPARRSLRIFPDLALKNVVAMRQHQPTPLIANLPVFAPSFIGILVILVSIFMIVAPTEKRGFIVHLTRPSPAPWKTSPWGGTMSVYVDGSGQFYLNERRVARQDLSEGLREELGKRMDSSVYFEADEAARTSDAEYAMNTIQQLGAKLIWLTPKTRKELEQSAQK